MKKHNWLIMMMGVLIIFSLVFLAACNNQPVAPGPEQPEANGETPQTVEKVKIGVLLPLSGSLASIGEQMRNGNEMAAQEINEAGGIQSLGGAQMELIFLDSEAKPEVAMGQTERAIDQEKVAIMTGAYHSASAMGATQVAERLATPFLIQVAGADGITSRGFAYVSRVSVNLYEYGYSSVEYLQWLNEEKDAGIKKIAVMYEDGEFGQAAAVGVKAGAEALGFEVGLDLSYPASSQDMVPYVTRLKDANVDALVAVSFISDALLLGEAIDNMQFDGVKVGISGGFVDPRFAENMGAKVESWFLADNFNSDIPGIEEVSDRYVAAYNRKMSGHAAHAYQCIYIIKDALERAAGIERDALNTAIRETVITPEDMLVLPYENIEFDETGQNIYAKPIFVQYQNGESKTVYPTGYASSEPIL